MAEPNQQPRNGDNNGNGHSDGWLPSGPRQKALTALVTLLTALGAWFGGSYAGVATHGERIARLETQVEETGKKLEKMDDKLDKLLARPAK